MGGDKAPAAIVAGALAAAESGIAIELVGDEATLRPLLPFGSQVPIVHAPDRIGDDEAAVSAVLRAPTSSLRVAIGRIATGARAAVTFGHSGAAMVAAVRDLGLADGVDRPAIATRLPRSDGKWLILVDAGANVDCKAEQLAGFAKLGVGLAREQGVANPRVGLIANGEEASKGNAATRAALALIEGSFHVEPHQALAGGCDVAVCDGFVGNVLLKTAEAVADTVTRLVRDDLSADALRRLREKSSWQRNGGGLLLGVNGRVVIGHGRSNAEAVLAAIRVAAG